VATSENQWHEPAIAADRVSAGVRGTRYVFSSSHFLVFKGGDPASGQVECSEPLHGHDYRIEVEMVGPLRSPGGWVVDFLVLEAALSKVAEMLDHKILLPQPSAILQITPCDQGQIEIVAPMRRWIVPSDDCAMLPIEATTTELICRHVASLVAGEVHRHDSGAAGMLKVRVEESAGFFATCQVHLAAK